MFALVSTMFLPSEATPAAISPPETATSSAPSAPSEPTVTV